MATKTLHAAIAIATLCSWMQFSVAVHSDILPIVVKQLSFMETYLAKSKSVSDDQNIVKCVETYQPILDSLTDEFQSAYEGCLKNSEADRKAADEAIQGDRKRLESSIGGVCAGFDKCSKEKEPENYFQCTKDQANIAHTEYRSISSDAYKAESSLVYSYESTIYKQKNCSDNLLAEYTRKTDKVNADLQMCLTGHSIDDKVETDSL